MKKWLLSILVLFLALPTHAALREGVEYRVLSRPQAADSKTIEVIEFFSYTCGHCYHLEPALAAWKKSMPKDVTFRQEQVVWRQNMEGLAGLFASLRASGELSRLHLSTFNAFLEERIDLSQPKALNAWLTRHHVNIEKFTQLQQSFTVRSAVAKAAKMTRDYQIEGTPTFVVGGRYATIAHEPQRLMEIVSELVEKVRQENKAQR